MGWPQFAQNIASIVLSEHACGQSRRDAQSAATNSRTRESGRRRRRTDQHEGDLVGAVTALKNEPGGNIASSGPVSVVRQLPAAGLLDELHLLVHPIAVRKGMRLFDEGETHPAEADPVRGFETGVLGLVYTPAESTGDATFEEAEVHLAKPQQ